MTTSTSSNLTRYLRQMLRTWEHDERPDAELLALYVRDRDDQAFATLVRRYSVLVWGVCYRILGHREEAEDAFQATFLVLARKAGQIYPKKLVGHWLYGVAQRTAQDVRKSLARRYRHEKQASTIVPTAYTDDVDRPDLLAVLDEEIIQLPVAYRLPLILCRLEGQTYAEAAQSLGCSTAAVGRRIVRAEELLRDRLIRRGVTLAGVSVAALLTQAVTAKEMSVCLVGNTIRAVQSFVRSALAPSLAMSIAQGVIQSIVFSPDGKVLAMGNYNGPIRLWDAATGKELRCCADCRSALSLAFSPDGKTLASGGMVIWNPGNQKVHFWDVDSGRQVRRTDDGHEGAVCAVIFTPDGKEIVSSSWEGSVRVWDAATGEQRRRVLPIGDEHFAGGWTSSIASAVSPDGKTIMSATWERIESKSQIKIRRWDWCTGQELRSWSRELGDETPHILSFSSDSKTVACDLWKTVPDQVHLWEVSTGREMSLIAGHYPAFSLDAKLLATAPFVEKEDEPGLFRLWDTATTKELCSVKVPDPIQAEGQVHRHVHRLLFSPDGRMLATASHEVHKLGRDNSAVSPGSVIHLWPLLRDGSGKSDVRVGLPRLLAEELRSLGSANSPYWFSAWTFSPDGRTLAISGEDGTVRLLETANGGKERVRFRGHGGEVMALSFSPDGRRLASGSRDTTLLVWDVTGRLQQGCLRPAQLSDKELERLWTDLASDSAARAGRAIWTLTAAADQVVPYLTERLRTSAADVKAHMATVPQFIRDLDADAFAVRQKARAELARLGEAVEPALYQALAKSPSLEMRRSLEELLRILKAKHYALSGEWLRGVRALEVLEHIGSRKARAALKSLTAGAEGESSLTHEARIALERLDRAERR